MGALSLLAKVVERYSMVPRSSPMRTEGDVRKEKKAREIVSQRLWNFFLDLKASLVATSESFFKRVEEQAEMTQTRRPGNK
jgi:hypothetical protein